MVVFEGQVGNDDATDAALHTRLAKGLDAVLHDGVEVAHQYQRNLHLVLDGMQLRKQRLERHAVLQGGSGSILDDRTIGHRVAEGNAYFNHVDASALHG